MGRTTEAPQVNWKTSAHDFLPRPGLEAMRRGAEWLPIKDWNFSTTGLKSILLSYPFIPFICLAVGTVSMHKLTDSFNNFGAV